MTHVCDTSDNPGAFYQSQDFGTEVCQSWDDVKFIMKKFSELITPYFMIYVCHQ